MSTNTGAEPDPSGTVMAAVEGVPEELILADVTRDEAWLSMALTDAVAIDENR